MFQLKIKPGVGQQKTVYFKNPKCGHMVEFTYSAPFNCPGAGCKEKPPSVDKLIGDYSVAQAARVKYFAEGKL